MASIACYREKKGRRRLRARNVLGNLLRWVSIDRSCQAMPAVEVVSKYLHLDFRFIYLNYFVSSVQNPSEIAAEVGSLGAKLGVPSPRLGEAHFDQYQRAASTPIPRVLFFPFPPFPASQSPQSARGLQTWPLNQPTKRSCEHPIARH